MGIDTKIKNSDHKEPDGDEAGPYGDGDGDERTQHPMAEPLRTDSLRRMNIQNFIIDEQDESLHEFVKMRHQMPQIKDIPTLRKDLASNGHKLVGPVKMHPEKLTPTQKNFNEDKIKALQGKKKSAIVISGDDKIIDGHHRWAAAQADKDDSINCYKMNMSFEKAFDFLDPEKSYVENRGINENAHTQWHNLLVTISDRHRPNHPDLNPETARNFRTKATNPDDAHQNARKFYRQRGYKVHDIVHKGTSPIINEEAKPMHNYVVHATDENGKKYTYEHSAESHHGIKKAFKEISKQFGHKLHDIRKGNVSVMNEADELNERALTPEEEALREKIVKDLKKNAANFKKNYGEDWKSVMYAVATKQAKRGATVNEENGVIARSLRNIGVQNATAGDRKEASLVTTYRARKDKAKLIDRAHKSIVARALGTTPWKKDSTDDYQQQ